MKNTNFALSTPKEDFPFLHVRSNVIDSGQARKEKIVSKIRLSKQLSKTSYCGFIMFYFVGINKDKVHIPFVLNWYNAYFLH